MGDYCTLRFTAKLNGLGQAVTAQLAAGQVWSELESVVPNLGLYLMDWRHTNIPFGGIAFIPRGWGDTHINKVTGTSWEVQCSTKSLPTLRNFSTLILPWLIRKDCVIEYMHELEHAEPLSMTVHPADPSKPPTSRVVTNGVVTNARIQAAEAMRMPLPDRDDLSAERYRKAFASERDIHKETAARLLKKPPEEITAEERRGGRALNFIHVYGSGSREEIQKLLFGTGPDCPACDAGLPAKKVTPQFTEE